MFTGGSLIVGSAARTDLLGAATRRGVRSWIRSSNATATATPRWPPTPRPGKVVKVQGEFVWHQHDETDEVFLVLDGKLTIDTPDGAIVLGPRETVMIPRDVQHRPRAERETSILLIEPTGVVNTGEAGGPLTASPESLI